MKFNKLAVATAVAMAFSASAIAVDITPKVSTGSKTGNYARMFKELQAACKDQVMMIEVESTGSAVNLDRILNNEVTSGIVQTDVMFSRARTEDLTNVKTLFALYPEEVHFVTLVTSPIKTGGVAGIGAKSIQLGSVSDLTGLPVAAWGGSVTTARVIQLNAEIAYTVVEVGSFKEAKALLDTGKVAAILMVGGQQMDDVKTLPVDYKLLPVSEATAGKLKSVYVPAKLNYSNLGQGGAGVPTIATDALFVTWKYTTPTYVQAMAELRDCFKKNASILAETPGMHKKWRSVDVNNTGKWASYDLPAITTVTVTAPAKKK